LQSFGSDYSFVPGRYGRGVRSGFTSSNSFFTFLDSSFKGKISISFHFQTTSSCFPFCICSQQVERFLIFPSTNPRLWYNGVYYGSSNPTLATGSYFHIVGTLDTETGVSNYYYEGIKVNYPGLPIINIINGDKLTFVFYILNNKGSTFYGSNCQSISSPCFSTTFDEIMIFSKILSDVEINSLRNNKYFCDGKDQNDPNGIFFVKY
jgi:hypothetical protein